jgi:hypothetical protein
MKKLFALLMLAISASAATLPETLEYARSLIYKKQPSEPVTVTLSVKYFGATQNYGGGIISSNDIIEMTPREFAGKSDTNYLVMKVNGVADCFWGIGSPEGVEIGYPGWHYWDTAASTLYIKGQAGAGTSTNWTSFSGGGGGTSVYVAGASVTNPNFASTQFAVNSATNIVLKSGLLTTNEVLTGVPEFTQGMRMSSVISPTQIAADQNDYNPTGLSTTLFIRLDSDAARNITGLTGQEEGREVQVVNIGAFNITLKNSSSSSLSTNRFAFITGDVILIPGSAVWLRYTAAGQWRAGSAVFLDAGAIASGTLAKARGGTGADNSSVTFPSSGTIPTTSSADTLTNKRITARSRSQTSTATLTPNIDSYNLELLTAQAADLTIANPTGTPALGDWIEVWVKAASVQNLAFGNQFKGSFDVSLPTTLTGSTKWDKLLFKWNSVESTWDMQGKNFGR